MQAFWFWPNIDAGTDELSKGIRTFRESESPQNIHFFTYLPPEKFIALLKGAVCLLGNSSAGIKECSFLGVPVINIGSRQEGRTKGGHIVDVNYNRIEIHNALRHQSSRGRFPHNLYFYKEGTARNIAEKLAVAPLYIQKKLTY